MPCQYNMASFFMDEWTYQYCLVIIQSHPYTTANITTELHPPLIENSR